MQRDSILARRSFANLGWPEHRIRELLKASESLLDGLAWRGDQANETGLERYGRAMAGQTAALDDFVVLASLHDRRAAERVVASLRHKFRAMARKGHASALVVNANPDGSLKVTQSRTLTSSDLMTTLLRLPVSWTIGFFGIFSGLKGTKEASKAAHSREGHVGSDEHAAHAILSEAGPHSALLLVRCRDQAMRDEVSARAADRAVHLWQGSVRDLLAALDPGTNHDWVRSALGQPSK